MPTRPGGTPIDISAEEVAVGAMLLGGPDVIDEIVSEVKPEHFYDPATRAVFTAVSKLRSEGNAIDGGIVIRHIQDNVGATSGVDESYIGRVMASIPVLGNAAFYARRIQALWRRRECIALAQVLSASARDMEQEVSEIIATHSAATTNLAIGDSQRSAQAMSDLADDLREHLLHRSDAPPEVSTPFDYSDLDDALGGIHHSQLLLIGGRPGSGKTSLLNSMALNILRRNIPIYYFSLEVDSTRLARCLLSMMTRIEEQHLSRVVRREYTLHPDDSETVEAHVGELQGLPLWIDDNPRRSVGELAPLSRMAVQRHGAQIIFLDYLQCVDGDGREQREKVGSIGRELKRIARELNVGMVATCQLTRANEREGRQPRMSDLRESGELEQDADTIVLLHTPPDEEQGESAERAQSRGNSFDWDETQGDRIVDVLVAKQRFGGTGALSMLFRKKFTRYESLSRIPPPEWPADPRVPD